MADPGGAAGTCPPPHGSRFFRFDIQIFRNVAASGVGAPYEVGTPPTGNPGSATDIYMFSAEFDKVKISKICSNTPFIYSTT